MVCCIRLNEASSRIIHQNVMRGHMLQRFASTSSNDVSDPHDHKWPTKSDPTPYDILKINPNNFCKRKLRSQYFKLAKVYHPDISKHKRMHNHKGQPLTDAHKNERFKLLSAAYSLLKDPRKRSAYDNHKVGWGNTSHHIYDDAFRGQRSSNASKQYYGNYQYWKAGTWEDYQELHRNQGNTTTASTEDKIKALGLVASIIIGGILIQGWYIFDSLEQSVLERKKIHDGCEEDLGMAYANFGLDTSKLSRIRRFLWFRTFGIYTHKDKLDQSSRENELLMKEILGEVE